MEGKREKRVVCWVLACHLRESTLEAQVRARRSLRYPLLCFECKERIRKGNMRGMGRDGMEEEEGRGGGGEGRHLHF